MRKKDKDNLVEKYDAMKYANFVASSKLDGVILSPIPPDMPPKPKNDKTRGKGK